MAVSLHCLKLQKIHLKTSEAFSFEAIDLITLRGIIKYNQWSQLRSWVFEPPGGICSSVGTNCLSNLLETAGQNQTIECLVSIWISRRSYTGRAVSFLKVHLFFHFHYRRWWRTATWTLSSLRGFTRSTTDRRCCPISRTRSSPEPLHILTRTQ